MRVLIFGLDSRQERDARQHLDGFSSAFTIHPVNDEASLGTLLDEDEPALVLAAERPGSGLDLPGILRLTTASGPESAFIGLTGPDSDGLDRDLVEIGAVDAFAPDQMWRLPQALARVAEREERYRAARKLRGMEVLLEAIRKLSLARQIGDIVDVVRHAARELSLADGATFVLRDGNQCHYVDEDAIGPLWRGHKFPMASCISGWAMINKRPAVIPDIYADSRIPIDAYRPTFVKSLVMVPIRTEAPIGAIGTYWARRRSTTEEEVALIQMLADSTALAVENVQFLGHLERRVKERTASLEGVNKELEAFSESVSHDLRSPLAVILGYSDLLAGSRPAGLGDKELGMIRDMRTAAVRMRDLIEDLLRLSRVTRREVEPRPVDLSAMAGDILAMLRAREPGRKAEISVAPGLKAFADDGLMRIALENLLSNAWKYTSTRPRSRIEVGAGQRTQDGSDVFYVRDNGVGFDMAKAQRLFEPFQRMHASADFPGTGVGLATVNRVIQKHGGRIWAESARESGSIFRFSLPSVEQLIRGEPLAKVASAN